MTKKHILAIISCPSNKFCSCKKKLPPLPDSVDCPRAAGIRKGKSALAPEKAGLVSRASLL
ncbi:hypothetical protein COX69_02550 [Candidatus Falkowbacteria bacterium CG_4_10_14_0_2_um_filter_48_10]|uniref:Uncharacterized protein n=1 Tax=Candidatus Falkowbacteria bacterium CG23_combo_of_CG06-09_8_20_14_all_49_15 TaxID=1974572 RepID=A0A2G9ZLV0_9BACT|nr:MAG: hypothetical protein COX22_00580 [Candidatus Falkowbacteria bacterium CG23_combo_of_CG06-09_8_20_14_all_49_15]PJA08341.1 MAG: hypothetical protein COX69_02550 [Candidatus Falkowbacteria bacterium CG_4_10_14_0_2_um_filter_48_10]